MEQPLSDIKVLDLTHFIAGPYCTKLLAHFGAEVIKIESLPRIDGVRMLTYAENDPGEDFWNRGGFFIKRAGNKYDITLDLTKPKGVEIFNGLVKVGDVVAESYSPRVMKNFGLDYPALKQIKPDIIMVSLSGYGDGPPRKIGISYTDPWYTGGRCLTMV